MAVVPTTKASFLLVKADNAEFLGVRLREHGIAFRRDGTLPGPGPECFRVAVRDFSTQRVLTRTLAQLVMT
ncbi:hypothetical protein GCM10009603_34330 [Nocardiopsis exhalans]